MENKKYFSRVAGNLDIETENWRSQKIKESRGRLLSNVHL